MRNVLIILLACGFSAAASAAGLGFNPFDKGSPTSPSGSQGPRPSSPSAVPAQPKPAAPVPAVPVKPEPQPGNKPVQQTKK